MGKYHYKRSAFRFKGKLPCLHIHEKNEKLIKWLIRIFTVAGIITSIFTLPWYFSLLLSIFLASTNIYLEKTTYYYSSLYIQSLPDFEYNSSKWTSMVYLLTPKKHNDAKNNSINIIGMVFNDALYAKKIFNLFRAWNYGSNDDTENNIKLSFITDKDKYYVYIRPSFDKKSIKQFHEEIEENNKLTKYGKEHFGLIVQLIICKSFSTLHGYGLGIFIKNHDFDKPLLLAPYLFKENEAPIPLFDIDPIKLYQYKAKNKSELTDDDFEYIHMNQIVNKKG
jgi:hypothetical protein